MRFFCKERHDLIAGRDEFIRLAHVKTRRSCGNTLAKNGLSERGLKKSILFIWRYFTVSTHGISTHLYGNEKHQKQNNTRRADQITFYTNEYYFDLSLPFCESSLKRLARNSNRVKQNQGLIY